jgi:hypothetical protein
MADLQAGLDTGIPALETGDVLQADDAAGQVVWQMHFGPGG